MYDGERNLVRKTDYKQGTETQNTFDLSGRLMQSITVPVSTSSGILRSTYGYEYDLNNNLTRLSQSIGTNSWNTVYTYDGDNRQSKVEMRGGVTAIGPISYDDIGRVSNRSIRVGGYTRLLTQMTYVTGANGSKTSMLQTYRNNSEAAYNYSYDNNGNIIGVNRGQDVEEFAYSYDLANQLTQVIGADQSTSTTYTYDNGGNILSKTTGGVTVNYTYANSSWKDQLMQYNGQNIVYDANGNPTTYRGYSMSWTGTELATMSKTGKNLSFTYDKDGIRTSKTYNGSTTRYYYNGSLLMGMTQGGNTNDRLGEGNTLGI